MSRAEGEAKKIMGSKKPENVDLETQGVPEEQLVLTSLKWNHELETLLFRSFINNIPTGINRHFNMMLGYKKFTEAINKIVDVHVLWEKLDTFYDLDILDPMLPGIPTFPNEVVDFELPEDMRPEDYSSGTSKK